MTICSYPSSVGTPTAQRGPRSRGAFEACRSARPTRRVRGALYCIHGLIPPPWVDAHARRVVCRCWHTCGPGIVRFWYFAVLVLNGPGIVQSWYCMVSVLYDPGIVRAWYCTVPILYGTGTARSRYCTIPVLYRTGFELSRLCRSPFCAVPVFVS